MIPEKEQQLTEHLTEQDVVDLALRFLNETRPNDLIYKRVQLVLNLGVMPLLAFLYEKGFDRGKSKEK